MGGDEKSGEFEQYERLTELSESPDYKVKLGERFLPIYHRKYDPDDDYVTETRKRLAEARIDVTPEMFISRSMGYGVILGLSLWFFVTLFAFLIVTLTGFETGTLIGVPIQNELVLEIVRTIRTPLVVLLIGIVFGSLGWWIGFNGPRINAGLQASSRRREIDMLLPDGVSYMYALSVGGLNQIEVIESVAESEDVYGELSREFQTIIQETEYFDVDYRTAIQHRAEETPSDNLAQFLADMLSILSSGGDLSSFLDDKTDKQLRVAKEDQEELLELLELFGEMYLNLSLLPLLLLILITIMQLMGGASMMMLYLVIYILIPIIGVGFIVMISAVLPDETGTGELESKYGESTASDSVLDFSTSKQFKGLTPKFDQIYKKEVRKRLKELAREPQVLFVERPEYTLIITIPLSLLIIVAGFITGIAPQSFSELFSSLWGTVYYVYFPLYLTLGPLTLFNYYHNQRKKEIKENYTEALRKLASANDTGQTLLESFATVAETSTGRLSDEFKAINAKVDYNYSVGQALTEFNNKYTIPELARINNLIIDAQETSSNISDVLITAAKSSENQDQLRRERATRTRMQMALILVTFLVLMAVIAMMQDQFINVMGEMAEEVDTEDGAAAGGAMDFDAIDPTRTGVLFFHAVIAQAITGGLLASYLRSNSLKPAGMFILPLTTIALVVWIVVM